MTNIPFQSRMLRYSTLQAITKHPFCDVTYPRLQSSPSICLTSWCWFLKVSVCDRRQSPESVSSVTRIPRYAIWRLAACCHHQEHVELTELTESHKRKVEEIREISADREGELERERARRRRFEEDCSVLRSKVDRLHGAHANGASSQEVRERSRLF